MTTFTFQATYVDATQTVTMMSNQGQAMVSGIPPWYCATQAGAEALQAWLKVNGVTTTIQQGWPLFAQTSGNRATQSAQVPFLADGKGAVENAGELIWGFFNLPQAMAAQIALEAFTLDDAPQGS
jgi:hypothetical protein